jgi:hypothetical protein
MALMKETNCGSLDHLVNFTGITDCQLQLRYTASPCLLTAITVICCRLQAPA